MARVKFYRHTFIDLNGVEVSINHQFTHIQATAMKTVLELDGISLIHAIALVKQWNIKNKAYGRTGNAYTIPFVRKELTSV